MRQRYSLLASFCALLFCLLQTASAQNQAPVSYYRSADGLKGKDLKVALGKILQHDVLSYSKLWSYYEQTDVVPGTQNQVFDYYSPDVYYFPGNGAAPSGANKEHACPQSWWGGGNGCNCYSDLFNVMPSESGANSAKSNYPLGITRSATYSNGRIKVGNSSRSAYSGKVFEPADEFKGDFARIYFYVATCYARAAWGSKSSVASTCAFTSEDYPTINSWILDLLLQWNAADPVSEWEMIRQERVYAVQGNRNPFIDYPQLADYIWGDSVSFAFDLNAALWHGHASGGLSDPSVDPDPDPTDDPVTDPDQPGQEFEVGDVLLSEEFSDITEGNDYSTSGSSKAWSGNEAFPDVSNCYMAGGVVRLGSSKGIGQMVSRPLSNVKGITLVVDVAVKGWTAVEGDLVVATDHGQEQALSYTSTINDSYQTLRFVLSDVSANSRVSIKTTSKRAFIADVRISAGEPKVDGLSLTSVSPLREASYTLWGLPLQQPAKGMVISRGRKCIFR